MVSSAILYMMQLAISSVSFGMMEIAHICMIRLIVSLALMSMGLFRFIAAMHLINVFIATSLELPPSQSMARKANYWLS